MTATTDFRNNDKSVPWYIPSITSVPDDVRDLLEKYSHIAPEEVVPHVVRMVRSTAFHSHIDRLTVMLRETRFGIFRRGHVLVLSVSWICRCTDSHPISEY